MNSPLAFHREATVDVAASPREVFAFLDDYQRLSSHMQKSSLIGQYRMGFELSPSAGKTRLRVSIEYNHPPGLAGRWLGKILGKVYANWCVTRIATDSVRAF